MGLKDLFNKKKEQQQPQPQQGYGMQQPQPQQGYGMQQPQPQQSYGMQQPQPQQSVSEQPAAAPEEAAPAEPAAPREPLHGDEYTRVHTIGETDYLVLNSQDMASPAYLEFLQSTSNTSTQQDMDGYIQHARSKKDAAENQENMQQAANQQSAQQWNF